MYAEEAFQAVLVELWRQGATLEAFGSWQRAEVYARKAVWNQCSRLADLDRRRRVLSLDAVAVNGSDPLWCRVGDKVSDQVDPVCHQWSDERLQEAYEALPPRRREAVDATVMACREPDEAAAYLDVPVGRLNRARRQGLLQLARAMGVAGIPRLPTGSKPGRLRRRGNVSFYVALAVEDRETLAQWLRGRLTLSGREGGSPAERAAIA